MKIRLKTWDEIWLDLPKNLAAMAFGFFLAGLMALAFGWGSPVLSFMISMACIALGCVVRYILSGSPKDYDKQ